jgi:hypothetical protein
MPRLSREISTHLAKARESALLAVETYNRPGTSFRSGGFIVLMCIAWTALLHAIFFKHGTKPFYRSENHRGHFKIVDGDRKAWELSTCITQYWAGDNPPERKNLEFFVGLRNKIEHRYMPALDIGIFGECQALLFNFEDMTGREFGEKYAVNESLSLALQFSRARSELQDRAIRTLHHSLARNIAAYVDGFRSSLSNEILGDPRFSYKVFLIPQPANHQNTADLAVEFLKFDASKPEEMERYERIVSLIKPSTAVPATVGQAAIVRGGEAVKVRIVNEPGAPAMRAIDYDDTHPYLQKALIGLVNSRLPDGVGINQYDLLAIRRTYPVETEANFYHKGAFGPSQYSDAFADWLVSSFADNPGFFVDARAKYREHQ